MDTERNTKYDKKLILDLQNQIEEKDKFISELQSINKEVFFTIDSLLKAVVVMSMVSEKAAISKLDSLARIRNGIGWISIIFNRYYIRKIIDKLLQNESSLLTSINTMIQTVEQSRKKISDLSERQDKLNNNKNPKLN